MFHLLFLYTDCACRSYFGCPIHRSKPFASSLTSYGRALWIAKTPFCARVFFLFHRIKMGNKKCDTHDDDSRWCCEWYRNDPIDGVTLFISGHPFLRLLFSRRLITSRRIMGRECGGEWCPRRLSIHLSNEGVSSALSQSSKMVDVRFALGIYWPLSNFQPRLNIKHPHVQFFCFFVFGQLKKKRSREMDE